MESNSRVVMLFTTSLNECHYDSQVASDTCFVFGCGRKLTIFQNLQH